MSNVKVYYNSGCPLCKAGIESQRCRMAAQGVDDVAWIDVHTDPAAVNDIGASLEFVRERLHVICDEGAPQIGIDAFSAITTPSQIEEKPWRRAAASATARIMLKSANAPTALK